jgi:hypothetical protein
LQRSIHRLSPWRSSYMNLAEQHQTQDLANTWHRAQPLEDVGAAEQHSNLVSIDRVVFRFAAVVRSLRAMLT